MKNLLKTSGTILMAICYSCFCHVQQNIRLMKRLILILAVIIPVSCNIVVNKCPKFDDDILSWFPYKLNEKIHFKSGQVVDTLRISHYAIGHYKGNLIFADCDGKCENWFDLNITSKKTMNFAVCFYNEGQLKIEDAYITVSYENMETYQRINIYLDYDVNLSNAQKAVFVVRENQAFDTFQKVVVEKNFGITSIQEMTLKKENLVWTIESMIPKKTSLDKINYQDIHCGGF
jgi:hypothetical protein